jgi:hypothetical protein
MFIIPALGRFENKPNIWIDAELNGLQTDEKIFLIFDLWLGHLVKILKCDEQAKVWSYIVFDFFWPYTDIIEKRQIYRFVEQLNLYRFVYNSILLEKQIEGKS